jgi:cell division protease FtsH
MEKVRRNQFVFSTMYIAAAVLAMYAIHAAAPSPTTPTVVPYSEFLSLLDQGRIARAELHDDQIIAALKPASERGSVTAVITHRLPRVDDTPVLEKMRAEGVVFSGVIEKTAWWQSLLAGWVIPMGLIMIVYLVMMRRVSAKSGPLSVGKNRAKIYDENVNGKVSFEDVAGVEEARGELVEIVEFLKKPDRYQALGARIPKGVLLVGPPGTGKTLLARAVAGEAGVPFFSLSGSEFVEMFVGVGAARMRDLFEQAKERAPCIVFIDELDAIGKSRNGIGPAVAHDEREQTLNQLLVEMDGFDTKKGVILMAATNRPEVLDQALMRPGRFDRQVLVDRPDLAGRHDILKVHARKVKLAEAVELAKIAQRTPGMVGADLANVVNEAALAAGRRRSKLVEGEDFEEAIDRIQLGLKKKGRLMNEDEKRRVAFHEAGHALVAMLVEHADPVHRVTIIPRSIGALGATLQLPTEERYLLTRAELLDRVCVMMGGRAAEQLVFCDTSTGAQNDLERATETARQMVCRFGMSDRLGAMTFGKSNGSRFLENAMSMGELRTFSEETAREIDGEIRTMVEAEAVRALDLLGREQVCLRRIAEALLARETIERPELEAIVAEARIEWGPRRVQPPVGGTAGAPRLLT